MHASEYFIIIKHKQPVAMQTSSSSVVIAIEHIIFLVHSSHFAHIEKVKSH